MPSATVIRAAFFAVGAAVGGGVATALGASKRKELAVALPASTSSSQNFPVIDTGAKGDLRLSSSAGSEIVPVLKYGNPGSKSFSLTAYTHFMPLYRPSVRPARQKGIRGCL